MVRKLLIIFAFAFVLNLIWEQEHSVLYLSYRGEEITNLILFRAALFDAAAITIFSYPFFRFEFLKKKRWMLYAVLVTFAIILEKWAIATGRWVYADAMPLIPLLNVGLTPAIQLGLLGYISMKISDVFAKKGGLLRDRRMR